MSAMNPLGAFSTYSLPKLHLETLTTTEIITDSELGYGMAGIESEKKKFQRDRKKLEEYGVHIREVKESGASETEESRWEIDRERTHIDTAVVTQDDADMLVHAVDEYLARTKISFRSALLRIRAVAGGNRYRCRAGRERR